jgi:hypothetical protein
MQSANDKQGRPPPHAEELSFRVLKQSGWGIASLVFFALACVSWTGCLVAANIDSAHRAIKPELTEAAIGTMLFGCGGFLLLSVGALLGGSGLCQQGRRKLCAYWGVGLNCAGLLVLVVLANWQNIITVFGGH